MTATLTLTIDECGNAVFLKLKGADMFCSLGPVRTQRGSWVTPCNLVLRVAFHVTRRLVSDDSRIAQWTRLWPCLWRAEIIGGPVFYTGSGSRSAAIEAEVSYLNQKFLEDVC